MISAHRLFNDPVETISSDREAAFFAGIRLANRTYKRTVPGRLRDLDQIVIRLARERGLAAPTVLDVGVSSGVTTLELAQAMIANGLKPSIIGTDIAIEARILDIAPGARALVDSKARPIQYELFGLGLRAWTRRLDYATGYRLLTKLGQTLAAASKSRGQEVRLVTRRIDISGVNVEFREDDLTVANPALRGKFDIVRAANVLNRAYFVPATLRSMIENLKSYVRGEGALIVVNRTHEDGTNHGTVFEVAANQVLRPIERVGNGSEIEEIL